MKPLRLCLLILPLLLAAARAQPQPSTPAALLADMTLEQKVGQMFFVSLYGHVVTDVGRDFLQTYQPGGVVVFENNAGTPQQVAALTNGWQQSIADTGGIPLLIAVDQEMGIIMTLEDPAFTAYPAPMLLAAAHDPALAARTGAQLAGELRAVGIHMNLAPVADLNTNLNNPIIGRRAWGSLPAIVTPALIGFIGGMQDAGVLATVKHFPGHGDTAEDSHSALAVVPHNRARLDSVELVPFRAAIEGGVGAVMVGHLWLPTLDAEPLPASLSYHVVTGLLRGEMGFAGLIVTDALDMGAIQAAYGLPQAAVLAVQAGVDVLLPGPNVGPDGQAAMIRAVVEAVRSGAIAEAQIDESVLRILQAKARYGVLDWQPIDTNAVQIDTDDGAALVDDIFRAGVTLAADSAGLLPVDTSARVQIVYPGNRTQIWRECSAYAPNALFRSVTDRPTQEDSAAAAQNARYAADITIVFTQDAINNPQQAALVNALPAEQTIVVALVSPFDWQVFPAVSSYLATYSPLPPAVTTACAVLFGTQTANGVLPVMLSSP